jgi:peptide/nickel transport system ATP-binding protein
MKQGSLIAMMISLKPSLLIADEPTTALDVTVQAQIMDLLREIREEVGMAVMLITHSIGLVAEESDRVAVMYAGKIVELATTEGIFSETMHPYTATLLLSLPVPDVESRVQKDILIKKGVRVYGEPPNLIDPPRGCRFHPRCPFSIDLCEREEPELRRVDSHLVACHRAGEIDVRIWGRSY